MEKHEPCPHCGWREGEGVKACRYTPELGQVTHGNEHPVGLSPEQQELYELWLLGQGSNHVGGPAWISVAERERAISETLRQRAEYHAQVRANPRISDAEKAQFDGGEPAWIESYSAQQRAKPLLAAFGEGIPITAPTRGGGPGFAPEGTHDNLGSPWIAEPFSSGMVYVWRRHKCGGHASNVGYRILCTGCELTFRLGDYGVDEDYG